MAANFCTVVYDNTTATFIPGQILSGKVEITLDKPKKVRGIIIHYRGAAETRWTEGTYDSDSVGNSTNITYSAEEIYFDTHYYCTGGKNHESFELSPGYHVYPFSYELPQNLPSSITGQVGSVSYYLEVIIDRPWKWDQKFKFPFTLTSPYDLNMFPKLKSPAQSVMEKTFCCWCCVHGPLTVVMTTSKGGYVPGETISIVVDVDNASNVNVRKIKLKFQQLTNFHGKYLSTRTKTETKVFEEMELSQIRSRSCNTWQRDFIVPNLSPSSIYISSIVRPEYQIFLEIVTAGCRTNLEMFLPIIIGTETFRNQRSSSFPPSYSVEVGNECNGDNVGEIGWVTK